MSLEPTNVRHDDDIDLSLVINRTVRFVNTYRIWLITLPLAGLLTGIVFYFALPRSYHSSLIANSEVMSNAEQIQILDTWDRLIEKREYGILAQQLKLPESVLAHLNYIKGAELQKTFSENNPNAFSIEISVDEINAIDEVEKGMLYGLENNEYVRKRVAIRKKKFQTLIRETETEIKKLEASKLQIENVIQGTIKLTTPVLLDPSGVSEEIITLNEKMLDYQEKLLLSDDIQVLQHFFKFRKPESPKLSVCLGLGFLTGFVLAMLSAVILDLRSKITPSKILS
jgi:hypothetical protein